MEELELVARSDFGIEVASRRPVTGSFSSAVLSFIGTDGRRYVLKRHHARNKAEREVAALRALEGHARVPSLLATSDGDDGLTLLIEGLDGSPWAGHAEARPEMLRDLGRSMRRIHATPAGSFDGTDTWHDLLGANADRYLAAIGADDVDLAVRAHAVLLGHLGEVPASPDPCLVHFDLRPGNVLVRDGRLVGIIDFEACRGGHPSMDLFKLWDQVSDALPEILVGYCDGGAPPGDWTDPTVLEPLMQVYAAYHGLAGLAWCHLRSQPDGDFSTVNRQLLRDAVAALG